MLASFLAALFFALNAACASRGIRGVGSVRANIGRLTVAVTLLGAFAHTVGHGFSSASVPWFLASGVVGMGLGDLAVYAALPLLGARITVLMTQCVAAPLAALAEWMWLGTRLSPVQIAWGLTILGGVAIAITPGKSSPPRVTVRPLGFIFGFFAACGQGFGAVISRKAVDVAEAAGEIAHTATFGITAAYHRIFAGFVFILALFSLLRLMRRLPLPPVDPASGRHAWLWVVAAGFCGPVIGVSSYQWALATTPSGIVLPIAATAPLLVMPIAYFLEGDRPSRRAILGGAIAVAGCAALTAAR